MGTRIEKICLALAGTCLCACLSNNLPYPLIDPEVTVEAEGVKSIVTDHVNHSIIMELEEQTDICHVNVTRFEISSPDGMTRSVSDRSPVVPGGVDLSEGRPFNFNISNYPETEYKWSIRASQDIERRFKVEGQIGASAIDPENHRIVVYVNQKVRLSAVTVKDMKLAADGVTSYSKTPEQKWNLLNECDSVDVTSHGRTERWYVYAEKSLVNVSWDSYCAWTRCVWLRANGVDGSDNGFCYRRLGDEQWTEIEKDMITHDGGTFTACIDNLDKLTTYECYAYSGEDRTETVTVTTEDEDIIPNGGFEVYSNAESSSYSSFYDPKGTLWTSKWWDSGNIGSTTVGKEGVICTPDTEDVPEGTGSRTSARLSSKYVVVKFAAGNVFSGEFAGLVGTNGGIVNFGRPWTARPRKLVLWVKTECGRIDHKDGAVKDVEIGDPDSAELYVALGDWDYRVYGGTPVSPVQVNTTKANTLFDPDSKAVIAYGRFSTSESLSWQRIEVPLDYRDCFRRPTHIIISCASSKYGDFFTGCSTNRMWVDEMEFIY